MDLNNLVFPCPAPSYDHDSLNSGAFISLLEQFGSGAGGPINKKKNDQLIAKMLYVPNNFELFETKSVDLGSCCQRNQSLNYSK
jgi:hypothetical protein